MLYSEGTVHWNQMSGALPQTPLLHEISQNCCLQFTFFFFFLKQCSEILLLLFFTTFKNIDQVFSNLFNQGNIVELCPLCHTGHVAVLQSWDGVTISQG